MSGDVVLAGGQRPAGGQTEKGAVNSRGGCNYVLGRV